MSAIQGQQLAPNTAVYSVSKLCWTSAGDSTKELLCGSHKQKAIVTEAGYGPLLRG